MTVDDQRQKIRAVVQTAGIDPAHRGLPHDKTLSAVRPSDFQSVLVQATVTIVIVGVIVVKPRQMDRLPAQCFVDKELVAVHRAEPPRTGKAEGSPLEPGVGGVNLRPENGTVRR